jgi:hypothetical protein
MAAYLWAHITHILHMRQEHEENYFLLVVEVLLDGFFAIKNPRWAGFCEDSRNKKNPL